MRWMRPGHLSGSGRLLDFCLAACALACIFVSQSLGGDRSVDRKLTDAGTSAEELARRFVGALAAGDGDRLQRLAVTGSEFTDLIWQHLPAGRPEKNLNHEFVWNQLQLRSLASLRRTLGEHGGQSYQFEGVRFAGGISQYGPLKVYRDTRIQVLDGGGKKRELNLLGSIVELGGAFKIYSFVH